MPAWLDYSLVPGERRRVKKAISQDSDLKAQAPGWGPALTMHLLAEAL
jgi:hypothetical protein